MNESRELVSMREIRSIAVILAIAIALYTAGVGLFSLDQLLQWFNTLISVMLSVISAFVVGLMLFRWQTMETNNKRREELAVLLAAELGELERGFHDSKTIVPDEVLKDLESGNLSNSHDIRLGIHHPYPLVTEEAARSSLFDANLTAEMLVLARDMRAHNLFLREATSLEPHMDRAWASGLNNRRSRQEFFKLLLRYSQAVRMVQRSEESILASCKEVLGGLDASTTR